MDSGDQDACVIDNGSYWTKAGFAGDDVPKTMFRSIVGKAPYMQVLEAMGKKGQETQFVVDRIVSNWNNHRGLISTMMEVIQQYVQMKQYYIGNEALSMRDMLTLKCPMENGFIKDWDEMVC